MSRTADVVVVGAGIAGVSAAYHLAVRHGVRNVAIVDPRPPLTLTSDKSTECYRNWWPNAPMVGLMNRSIDLFEELSEETDYGFNRNGYLFVTGDASRMSGFVRQAEESSRLGADAKLLTPEDLGRRWAFLTEDAVGGVFVPRAGWFRAQDLGQWLLDRSREAGVTVLPREVTDLSSGRVVLDDGTALAAGEIVIAAGPLCAGVAGLVGIELPLFSELHLKVGFRDHLGVIPRDAPMTIWSDPQELAWTPEERAGLEEMGREDVLGEMPIFCHFRPEGGAQSPYVLALWEYHGQVVEPVWPIPSDPLYPEIVMRGLTRMVPGLEVYHDRMPESFVDGGYYTKTAENRPLLGPSGVDGISLMAGMSGFGVMVSSGAADLVARHIVGADLPDYATDFLLARYDDPSYVASITSADSGQL